MKRKITDGFRVLGHLAQMGLGVFLMTVGMLVLANEATWMTVIFGVFFTASGCGGLAIGLIGINDYRIERK